jgi:preprotein translocase subunit SecA
MAKADLRAMQIPEEYIAQCAGATESDDEELERVRTLFRELVEKHREEIAPEAEKVRAAGGLFILGSERHESRRIDNQLRGRSGRQGDPGESKFFLSMEDDLMRLFGQERLQAIVTALKMPEDMAIDAKILSNAIERAQKNIEDANFKRRKYVLAYDDVMNQQRNIIYRQRQDVLNGEDISETIQKMVLSTVASVVEGFTRGDLVEEWDFDGLRAHFMGSLTTEEDFRYTEDELKSLDREALSQALCARAIEHYHEREELFGQDTFREVERAILLRSVDTAWMEHIDTMDDLKGNVGLQSYAQRDPINEYRIQGADLFDTMVDDIRQNTVRAILSAVPRTPIKRVQVANPLTAGFEGEKKKPIVRRASKTVVNDSARIGRNDPCPCGSGKKYKNCCMRNEAQG